jgi:predicted amidohydrolase YtcJ
MIRLLKRLGVTRCGGSSYRAAAYFVFWLTFGWPLAGLIATLNAARDLGREKEIGSLEPGKIADLAIVAVDPLRSVEFLDRIDLVIKDGRVVFDYYADAVQSE